MDERIEVRPGGPPRFSVVPDSLALDDRVNAYGAAVYQALAMHCDYGTGKNAGLLKDSAPVYHTSAPDADNILKFVGDALNGIFWRDDRQIAIARINKVYAGSPGIHIDILTLKETHNAP